MVTCDICHHDIPDPDDQYEVWSEEGQQVACWDCIHGDWALCWHCERLVASYLTDSWACRICRREE